jgi:hypothetical protein
MTSCVTIEWIVGLVRLHDAPAKFGEHAPYSGGFALVQVGPGIFEAKLSAGTVMTPAQRRDLRRQLEAIGAQAVYYWRFKEGREPYKVWIARRSENVEIA